MMYWSPVYRMSRIVLGLASMLRLLDVRLAARQQVSYAALIAYILKKIRPPSRRSSDSGPGNGQARRRRAAYPVIDCRRVDVDLFRKRRCSVVQDEARKF